MTRDLRDAFVATFEEHLLNARNALAWMEKDDPPSRTLVAAVKAVVLDLETVVTLLLKEIKI